MYLTHRYVSEIGTVPTVYDLLNVIVGYIIYIIIYDKSSGNFPFINANRVLLYGNLCSSVFHVACNWQCATSFDALN